MEQTFFVWIHKNVDFNSKVAHEEKQVTAK